MTPRAHPRQPTVDVVVVGAGPVGLMLAGELRLGGATVLVVDRLPEPTGESRASTLHESTLDLFAERGLLGHLNPARARGVGHFGGLPLDVTGLDADCWEHAKVPQWRTEQVLEKWATGLGAELQRGRELVDVDQDAAGVTATTQSAAGERATVRASYLVGCDGHDSSVRRLAGIMRVARDANRELLRADIVDVDIPGRRFERLENGFAVAARDGDVTRVMVHEFGARPRTEGSEPISSGELAQTWKRVTGDDIDAASTIWLDAFDDASAQAQTYRCGRVFLAGDAAHHFMPVGGLAINVGLLDAVNLGWKLARVVGHRASPELLRTYDTERHRAGERIRDLVEGQTLLLLGTGETEGLRSIVTDLLGIDRVRRHLADAISGRDLVYEHSPGEHPMLGRRLRSLTFADDSSARTAVVARRRGHSLVAHCVTAPPQERRYTATIAQWPDVSLLRCLRDDSGVFEDAEMVLVRPDGHIAWVGPGPHDLFTAMRTWLGRPPALLGEEAS